MAISPVCRHSGSLTADQPPQWQHRLCSAASHRAVIGWLAACCGCQRTGLRRAWGQKLQFYRVAPAPSRQQACFPQLVGGRMRLCVCHTAVGRQRHGRLGCDRGWDCPAPAFLAGWGRTPKRLPASPRTGWVVGPEALAVGRAGRGAFTSGVRSARDV